MKRIITLTMIAGIAAALMLSAGSVCAQDEGGGGRRRGQGQAGFGPGGFDPAQMQERILERYREALGFTNQTEWDAVRPLVQKVLDAQREVMMVSGRRMMRAFRGGPGGFGGPEGGPFGQMAQPSPAEEALQKAIDSNASREELKAAMEKVRQERKQKQEALRAAQEELRKVLTLRQEAIALQMGLIE